VKIPVDAREIQRVREAAMIRGEFRAD